jgi:hypothetical protein
MTVTFIIGTVTFLEWTCREKAAQVKYNTSWIDSGIFLKVPIYNIPEKEQKKKKNLNLVQLSDNFPNVYNGPIVQKMKCSLN